MKMKWEECGPQNLSSAPVILSRGNKSIKIRPAYYQYYPQDSKSWHCLTKAPDLDNFPVVVKTCTPNLTVALDKLFHCGEKWHLLYNVENYPGRKQNKLNPTACHLTSLFSKCWNCSWQCSVWLSPGSLSSRSHNQGRVTAIDIKMAFNQGWYGVTMGKYYKH